MALPVVGGKLLGQAAGDVHIIAWIAVGLGRDQPQIGSDHAQEVDLFLRLGLRHDDHAAVAAGVADQGQADAGVAGGALYDRAALTQGAALFGIDDDRQSGAILDRAAGFMNSALPRIVQPVASEARRRRISGVLPIV